MSSYQFDFARALGVLYPIGKRAADPKLPPSWAPPAVAGLDFRPSPAPPRQERCERCRDWFPTAVWYDDDEEPPPQRVCSQCGFEQIRIHVVHVDEPVTYLDKRHG